MAGAGRKQSLDGILNGGGLRARLEKIDQQLDGYRELVHEKRCIEKAISALEGIDKYSSSAPAPLPAATVWEGARDILAKKGGPMTVKQITDALPISGVQIEGKHRMESVRVALIRKPEVIEKLTDGRYQLKK